MKGLHWAVGIALVAAALGSAAPAGADPAPPANDTIAGAVEIGSDPFDFTATIDGATTDPVEANLAAECYWGDTPQPGQQGVWFKYTANVARAFDLSGSSPAWIEIVYANSDGSLSAGGCSTTAYLPITAAPRTPGETVYILLFEASPSPTPYELHLQSSVLVPPANDTREGAVEIAGDTQGLFDSASQATTDQAEMSLAASCSPSAPLTAEAGVWFRYSGDEARAINVDPAGMYVLDGPWAIAAYSNPDGSLTSGPCGRDQIRIPRQPGRTVYVLVVNGVDPWRSPNGFFIRSSVGPAAAPNDSPDGAIEISGDPYAIGMEVPWSTGTDHVETDLAANCTPDPPLSAGAGVWFRYTSEWPRTIDVSGFDAWAIAAYPNADGSFTAGPCGRGSVTVPARPGQTVYVLVVDETPDADGSFGGWLSLYSADVLPPPQVSMTVNPTGSVNQKTGVATLAGTFTCRYAIEGGASATITLSQPVGRFIITGTGSTQFNPCDGQAHTWTAQISLPNGKFAGGKATVAATAQAWNRHGETTVYDTGQQAVKLQGGK